MTKYTIAKKKYNSIIDRSFKSFLDFYNEEIIGNNNTRIGFTIDS